MRMRTAFLLGTAFLIATLVVRNAGSSTEFEILFGNLHSHTSYSDGSGTPAEAFTFAHNAGLDFLGITEHNHHQAEQGAADRADGILIAKDPTLYDDLIHVAEQENGAGHILALWGQEFSSISKGNHLNVFSVRAVIDDAIVPNGQYKTLYDSWLPDHPEVSFIQFNHPWDLNDPVKQYGLDNYQKKYWKLRNATAPYVRTIEVINGPGTKNEEGLHAVAEGESFFQLFLTRGFRLAPSADQDNHYRTWGTLSDARTGVLTTGRSLEDLVNGIRARRLYASTDKNLRIHYWVNDAIMGSEVSASTRTLNIKYDIHDDDETQAPYKVVLVYGNPNIPDSATETTLGTNLSEGSRTTTFTTPHQRTFAYLKVIQWPDSATKRDKVFTSPVWITVP